LVLRSVVLKGVGEILEAGDLVFGFGGGEFGKGREEEGGERARKGGEEKGSVFDAALWMLAHEIKNPLVAINTFASLLPERYGDEEFREEFSRLVSLDVKRINELLENLLEYGQFGEPQVGRQDLNGVIGEVLGQREKELGERGVQLEVEMGSGLPGVSFDGVQLGYVLRNVLGDACLRVRESSYLRLRAGLVVEGEGKRFVELGVWYEGQNGLMGQVGREGVDEGAELETRSLALTLARKVMVRNRGEMWVSLEEGVRTAIRLRFPVAEGNEK
jgi:polar amino acid transport system substrate-binding protein